MLDTPTPNPPESKSPGPDDSGRIDAYIAIWTKAVDTQMHFNEMSAKSRQLKLTFVAAALGVSIVLLGRREDFSLQIPFVGLNLHISVLIFLATAFAVYAVSILDLKVYHRMLRGAVTFGEDFEENYLKAIVKLNKGMTQAISHYSRVDDATVRREGSKYVYQGVPLNGSAENRIWQFYKYVIFGLIAAALITFATTCRWAAASNHDSKRAITSGQAKSSVAPRVENGNKPDTKVIEPITPPTAPATTDANK